MNLPCFSASKFEIPAFYISTCIERIKYYGVSIREDENLRDILIFVSLIFRWKYSQSTTETCMEKEKLKFMLSVMNLLSESIEEYLF